jgi:hypothetical protein
VPPSLLPFAQSALECASCVVASISDEQVASSPLAQSGVRFIACAPVMLGAIPIGVLALVDGQPHPFSGMELSLLELVAARAAIFVGKPGAQRLIERSGLVRMETFLRAFNVVMQLRRSPVLAVAVARFQKSFERGLWTTVVQELAPQTLIGALGRRSFTAFTAAPTAAEAEQRLSELRARAAAVSSIDAWAQVVLEQSPPVTPEALIAWCERMANAGEGEEHPLIGIEVKGIHLGAA